VPITKKNPEDPCSNHAAFGLCHGAKQECSKGDREREQPIQKARAGVEKIEKDATE